MRLGILISGRGSNMRSIVGAVRDGRLSAEVALVLSNKQRAPGLSWALENGLPTAAVSRKGLDREAFDARIDAELRSAGVDLVVLAGFMRVLSPWFVRQWRIVNIHPSLLPDFPGLDVHQRALDAGVSESGCTVHFVDEGVDTGPIIAQRRVPVLAGDTEDSLAARILEQEHVLYPEAIQRVIDGD